MAENGRRAEDHLIGFVNPVGIADTWEEAFESIAEPCLWMSNVYGSRKDLEGKQPPESALVSMETLRKGAETGQQVAFATPIVGTVDQIIDFYLPIVRGEHPQGLTTHLGLEVRTPGVRTEDAHRTMRLFAEHVLPVLAEEAAKAGR
ncbi:hypothetical protein [Nocardia miyunensis]|uniref:hypothetical protein n=1 Tax=Nocardia miyunensis TaxID=282684 RepID=UPI00082EB085|nr:hypothetical protein [Nocardia miyunensis]